jgi:hypothetical protein
MATERLRDIDAVRKEHAPRVIAALSERPRSCRYRIAEIHRLTLCMRDSRDTPVGGMGPS